MINEQHKPTAVRKYFNVFVLFNKLTVTSDENMRCMHSTIHTLSYVFILRNVFIFTFSLSGWARSGVIYVLDTALTRTIEMILHDTIEDIIADAIINLWPLFIVILLLWPTWVFFQTHTRTDMVTKTGQAGRNPLAYEGTL